MPTVKFKGQDIEARELTVEDLDKVMSKTIGKEKVPVPMIDRIFDNDLVGEDILEASTGLTVEELRKSKPSDLRPLVDAVKEANPDFFAAMSGLVQ